MHTTKVLLSADPGIVGRIRMAWLRWRGYTTYHCYDPLAGTWSEGKYIMACMWKK